MTTKTKTALVALLLALTPMADALAQVRGPVCPW